jgi:hypothetical protein
MARSVLLNDKNEEKFYDIQLVTKMPVSDNNNNGTVYFFKYKIKPGDEWKIGISGMQPARTDSVSCNDNITKMTDKKFKEFMPANEQFTEQLQRLLLLQHKSAAYFFKDDTYDYSSAMRRYNLSGNDDEEDN